jgi:hypothetical protein
VEEACGSEHCLIEGPHERDGWCPPLVATAAPAGITEQASEQEIGGWSAEEWIKWSAEGYGRMCQPERFIALVTLAFRSEGGGEKREAEEARLRERARLHALLQGAYAALGADEWREISEQICAELDSYVEGPCAPAPSTEKGWQQGGKPQSRLSDFDDGWNEGLEAAVRFIESRRITAGDWYVKELRALKVTR